MFFRGPEKPLGRFFSLLLPKPLLRAGELISAFGEFVVAPRVHDVKSPFWLENFDGLFASWKQPPGGRGGLFPGLDSCDARRGA